MFCLVAAFFEVEGAVPGRPLILFGGSFCPPEGMLLEVEVALTDKPVLFGAEILDKTLTVKPIKLGR